MRIRAIAILTITSVILTGSCKKKAADVPVQATPANTDMINGLPANRKAINGYFYSCIQTNAFTTGNPYYNSFAYAALADPARNLINSYNHYANQKVFSTSGGNIDVGNVFQNEILLNKSLSNSELYYNYSSNNVSAVNSIPNWTDGGNESFKPINTNLNRGYPTIASYALSSIPASIAKASGFTIDFGNNVVANYDSLLVTIQDDNYGTFIVKAVAKNSTSVTFTTHDMIALNATSYGGRITVCAINYSTITINNKVNVFELSNQYVISNVSIY